MKKEGQIPGNRSEGTVVVPDRLKLFDRSQYFAVLATQGGGQPYASLVSYALTPDMGTCIFATPRKTRKYRNILKEGRVALLIDDRPSDVKDILEAEAVTIIGEARPLRRGKTWDRLAQVYLRKHPDLEEFLRLPSTALVALTILQCIHVSRFQTVSLWDRGSGQP